MLGHNGEDAGRQRHVEQAVCLLESLLQLLDVAVEPEEGLILVVLARNVGAEAAELVKLLLGLFGRRLDVRADSPNVFIVIHLGSGIADDPDVFWQELVAVLHFRVLLVAACAPPEAGCGRRNVACCFCRISLTRPKRAGYCQTGQPGACAVPRGAAVSGTGERPTVFFFARSPEAPSTTIVVSDFSSIMLWGKENVS